MSNRTQQAKIQVREQEMAKKKAKEQERLEERGHAIFFPDYNAFKESRKAAKE